MFKSLWDIEKIKAGFERFVVEHNRLPTATEIDKLTYLPSSRTIQREYGGLEKLRMLLGYTTTHLGRGINRSLIAKNINARGKVAELEVFRILSEKFGAMFVHVEKPFSDNSKQRLDFYVYTPTGNFGVDVFHPTNEHSMIGSINIKKRIYSSYKEKVYLVIAGNEISTDKISKFNNDISGLSSVNPEIITVTKLAHLIKNMGIYRAIIPAEE
jgi:hypothetical protein